VNRWFAAVLAILVAGHAAAQGMRLLDQTGLGIVPVNDEKLVHLRGFEGEILLESGEPGNVEFSNLSMTKSAEEVPLALFTDDAEFRLEPPSGHPAVKTRLRVRVPPDKNMKVLVETDNTLVHVSDLNAELVLRGRQIRLDAAGLRRRTEVEIDGGSVKVQGAGEGFTFKGQNVDAVIDSIAGPAIVRMTGGTAKLTGFQSTLQGQFVRTRVGVDTVVDVVDLHFQQGKAKLVGLRVGGQVALQGCLLELSQISGELTVTSDSDVQFSESKASLHIFNTSGGVLGMRNDGLVEVTTHSAAVKMSLITGQLRVAGDELEVYLKDIAAAVTVNTQSSKIGIEGSSSVTIENDGGDVAVQRSEALIDVKSRNGEVRLLDMGGPVSVDADGPSVEVSWTRLPPDRDSRIVNDGGEVTVKFLGGDSRVSAVSQFGRVDSDLPGVRVVGDEHRAEGIVGGGSGRTIAVKASGDVHLLGPDSSGQTP
jgi:hypothetical protein